MAQYHDFDAFISATITIYSGCKSFAHFSVVNRKACSGFVDQLINTASRLFAIFIISSIHH